MDEKALDVYKEKFHQRYILKKKFTIFFSILIVFCGVSGILYSALVFKNNIFDRMRYMTFDGTMFTTLISYVFIIISIVEARENTEMTNRFVYYMRLSSATTEFIIFIVVMVGLSPLVPDNPDITSYPGIMMHLMIPVISIGCFIFNDAPIGKMKPLEPFHGTTFITIYAAIMTFLFGTRILPSSLAPYSFLDFDHHSTLFSLGCLLGIYTIGYFVSIFFVRLNRRYSWIWYKNIKNDLPKSS